MSTPTPSFRLPFTLPDDVHPAVKDALRLLFNGMSIHEQAFTALTAKVNAISTTPTTTTTPPPVSLPGGVNDQTGAVAYTTQQSDYGSLIILNSASAVAVSLNNGNQKPFYTQMVNRGAGTVTLTPVTGTINGLSSITLAPNATMHVYINSADFNWNAA